MRAFAAAVADEHYQEAYAWMSREFRQRVAFSQFRELLEAHPDETRRTVRSLSRVTGPAEQWAELPYGDREQLLLVRDQGQWRLATHVLNFYPQGTPRECLRTFVRALERRRYRVVLRLVPSAHKEGVTEERMKEAWEGESREDIERMLSNLRENMNNPIEQVGDHASMPYGERLRVVFLREEGRWKIVDPE